MLINAAGLFVLIEPQASRLFVIAITETDNRPAHSIDGMTR